ncbi:MULTISPECIES: RNA polymerase sigma factor [Blautia]|uniref:Sigma-70 family RNA polymerase sigma factor n=1 Tax=Blautia obeum TaxID=40520 RepID=A0A414JAI3_9FIRM|nr:MULTISPECIES: sigma-70 family RNA polymerase sigma factor [Blautia]RHE41478.1 sigma-70 family RNA polymerase sigma factor [Blautia obeum]
MDDLKKPEVFAAYYEKVYRELYYFALHTLKNPQDAEDAVSEAVADAFATVEKLRDQEKFRVWIFQILSNKCKRKLKEYTQKTVELPDDLPTGDATEESLQVREALDRLDETERRVICLNVIGGFKSHEIGEMMQMNHNTVRSRISRGLNKMKEFLA